MNPLVTFLIIIAIKSDARDVYLIAIKVYKVTITWSVCVAL